VTVDPVTADDGPDDEPTDIDTTDLDLLYAPANGLEGDELRRVLHEIAKQDHRRLISTTTRPFAAGHDLGTSDHAADRARPVVELSHC
jgi:hypothetical protein